MDARIRKQDPTQEFWTPERCFILETWNEAADPAVSVARARVERGITTQLHALDGIDERYLVVEGTGFAEIAGEVPTPVEAGDLVCIPAGVSQRITNTGSSDLAFYCICTPPFVPDAYIDLLLQRLREHDHALAGVGGEAVEHGRLQ